MNSLNDAVDYPEFWSLREANITGRRVLVRIVLNVPLGGGVVVDDRRLRLVQPTLRYLLDHGVQLMTVCGYVGRPGGRVVEELRVKPVAERLQHLLPDAGHRMVVLENTRFDPREEKNDPELAKELAHNQDFFVNDAFADDHREYASTYGVTKFLPAYAGFLVEKEVLALTKVRDNPDQPLVMIVGGVKAEDKEPVIEYLLPKAEKILVGGQTANELLIRDPAWVKDEKIVLPKDGVLDRGEWIDQYTEIGRLLKDHHREILQKIRDIGPVTIGLFEQILAQAKTILWIGPLGKYEDQRFAHGTQTIVRFVASLYGRAQVLIGGGDTAAAVERLGLANRVSFISTGGGATLEFLAGRRLPALEPLYKRSENSRSNH